MKAFESMLGSGFSGRDKRKERSEKWQVESFPDEDIYSWKGSNRRKDEEKDEMDRPLIATGLGGITKMH